MNEKTIMVKIDAKIHNKLKLLAKYDKRSMGNFVSVIVEDLIEKRWSRHVSELKNAD